jgi:5-methylcytosine-specific restriction endonuclease McrA
MRKPKELHRFYKSTQWQVAREIKIRDANGKCERCGALGEEVHHIIKLTVQNVIDPTISLNQDNLEFLCKKCHNAEHKRFSKEIEFDEDGNFIQR